MARLPHWERKGGGNNVTITQGEGTRRIVRRIERNSLPGGKWEMIESYRKINEETPVSCVRTVQKHGRRLADHQQDGRLQYSLAQTTLYTYNDQFGYLWKSSPTEATRATSTTTRGASFCKQHRGRREKRTRTTYADLRFNDFRPATEREIIIAQDGTETVLKPKELYL